MKSLLLTVGTIFILTASSCGGKDNGSTPEVKIIRFDRDIASYPQLDSSQREEFRNRYSGVLMMTVGPDTITDKAVETYARGKAVTMFGPDIQQRFTTQDSIERVLTDASRVLSELLPSLNRKAIYGGVSTYNQSIIMTDTIMLVGLNHYLGADYPAYAYFETYRRGVKTQRHLPYDIIEAMVAGEYPYIEDENASLLNRMLYEGAVTYMVMKSIPDADLAEAMGYTPEQMQWINENEGNIWRHIIEQRYLYSTDRTLADRLCRPAPSSPAIHSDSPGRAGKYIGYRIVAAYMDSHPSYEAAQLLTPGFYNATSSLINAGYSPK